ncbi:hypothetical protein [Lactobacillus delbrueckii]|uniref:hypothetical protein n=1 Tax=Lactobacillus delbrueckii TaxID=1584 RepID=UPI0037C86189
MPIAYEEVNNLARLPFKFFKRSNYVPKAPTHWHTGIEIDYLISGEDFKVVIAGQTHHYNSGDIWAGLLTAHKFMPRRGTKTGLIM